MRFCVVGFSGPVGYGEGGDWLGVLIQFEGQDEVIQVDVSTDYHRLPAWVPEDVRDALVPPAEQEFWPHVFTAWDPSDPDINLRKLFRLVDPVEDGLFSRMSGDAGHDDPWEVSGDWAWHTEFRSVFHSRWFSAEVVYSG